MARVRRRSAAEVSFTDLVKDALAHLHDTVYLERHPLAVGEGGRGSEERRSLRAYTILRQRLLSAVEQLRPEGDGSSRARDAAIRARRLLELRYVEALDPS